MRTPSSVGLVGLGVWGPTLAHQFDRLPQTELRWLCDFDPARRLALGRRFAGVAWSSSVADLLSDEELDALVIATPIGSHHALAQAALMAGKHVFVESPIATNGVEAEDLVELARSRELQLMVGHAALFDPAVVRLKNMIDAGELGQVLYLHASRRGLGRPRADEDALWSLGAHDVSTVLSLLGDEPTTVSAHGDAYVRPGVVDVVFCHLEFATGIAAHLHLSWLDPEHVHRICVVGTERMAVLDMSGARHQLSIHDQRAAIRRIDAGGEIVEVSVGDTLIPRVDDADPVQVQCARFGELLHRRPGSAQEPRHAATVVATLAALQRSLGGGGPSTPLAVPAAVLPAAPPVPPRLLRAHAPGAE